MISARQWFVYLCWFWVAVVLPGKGYAQQSALDSLLAVLEHAPEDSQKVALLGRLSSIVEADDPMAAILHLDEAIVLSRKIQYRRGLARATQDKAFFLWYYIGDYDEAMRCNKEAYALFLSMGDKEGEANSYQTFANIVEMKGYLDSALLYNKKSLAIRRRLDDKMTEAWSLTNLGITYNKLGMFDSALYYKSQALQLYESLGEMGGIAGIRNNMGIVYMEKGEYNKALENHLKSLRIRRELDDKRGMIASYQNIGEVFQKQGDLNRALMYYQQAMKIKIKTDSRVEEANTYHAVAQIKELQMLYDEAEDYYSRSLALFREMGNTVSITTNLLGLGRVSKAEKNYRKAIEYFLEARQIQVETGDISGQANSELALGNLYLLTEEKFLAQKFLQNGLAISRKIGAATIIRDAHRDLASFYAYYQEFEKALTFNAQYEHIKDSLFQEEKSRTIGDIQMEYELIEKENQIEELTLQREIDQLTRYGTLIGLGGIILLSILAMLYIRYQIQTRANLILAQQKQEIEAKNKELAISNLELDQFAHVVSHDLKQPLRMISNYSTLLERKFSDSLDIHGKSFLNFVSEGVHNLHDLISDLLDYSQINHQLSSVAPVNMNEVMSIVQYTLRQQIKDTSADIQVGNLPTITGNASGLTQLLVQLVSNSLKFVPKGIPQIRVGYVLREKEHLFSVSDNGVGIAPEYQQKIFYAFLRLHTNEEFSGTGIGLAIAQKIVAWHNGRIWVESEPGNGSTFYFSIPEYIT